MTTHCQALTKKGTPCKNNSVNGDYCKTHQSIGNAATESAEPNEALSSSTDSSASSSAQDQTGITFGLLLQANETLVNSLTTAIDFIPGALEKLFKYSGSELLMPKVASSVKDTMSDQTRQVLMQIRDELEKIGDSPSKYEALMLQTRRLESIATDVLLLGGRFIPKPVKNEISKALDKLKELKLK